MGFRPNGRKVPTLRPVCVPSRGSFSPYPLARTLRRSCCLVVGPLDSRSVTEVTLPVNTFLESIPESHTMPSASVKITPRGGMTRTGRDETYLGAHMMMPTPTRQTTAPTTSKRSGLIPSIPQPQRVAMTTKMPPYAA